MASFTPEASSAPIHWTGTCATSGRLRSKTANWISPSTAVKAGITRPISRTKARRSPTPSSPARPATASAGTTKPIFASTIPGTFWGQGQTRDRRPRPAPADHQRQLPGLFVQRFHRRVSYNPSQSDSLTYNRHVYAAYVSMTFPAFHFFDVKGGFGLNGR